jgi:[acyl-carrier-protein] S-malonyltransferase
MSNPATILCPGQGAQVPGMGKAWAGASPEARAVFTDADAQLGDRLGAPLSALCFEGPAERLNRTDVSQPAIFVTSIACWRAILASNNAGNGEYPLTAAMGLSLGEYTALHIAGGDFVPGCAGTGDAPRAGDAGRGGAERRRDGRAGGRR